MIVKSLWLGLRIQRMATKQGRIRAVTLCIACKIHRENSKNEILIVVYPHFYPCHSRKDKSPVIFWKSLPRERTFESHTLNLGTAHAEGQRMAGRVVLGREERSDSELHLCSGSHSA